MKKIWQLSALLMAVVLMLVACTPDGGGTTTSTSGQNDTTTSDSAGAVIQSAQVPFFNNSVNYERGGVQVKNEQYMSYQAYISMRHTFKDMEFHDAEMAAVRLADIGVFEKTENFEPNKIITVFDYVRGILILAGKATAETPDTDIATIAAETDLIQKDVQLDMTSELTREWMAYLLDRASLDHTNALQYQLVHADYEQINVARRTSVLQCLALGLWPMEGKFDSSKTVTRAEAALTLYRLSNPNMRLIPEYDLGDAYQEGVDTYLVKNTYEQNEGGIQFGFYSDYNHQDLTFRSFGRRTIDRTDFSKWVDQELEKGVYTFSGHGNDQFAHLFGSTAVHSVEVAANLIWNPDFHRDIIPSFYKTDITDPETRRAAKAYLYNWTQALLSSLKGDVYVSLDYEVDWEMALSWAIPECMERAKIWGEWYVEACQVMRDAAQQAGAADRLKLLIIYNNVTDLHKLGPAQNQWMLDCAEASDFIGIDVYFYGGWTDATAVQCAHQLIQDMRYLINNYSLGKPVMIIENGVPQGGVKEESEELYYKTLFRELQFALDRGDFLNRNFNAYLIWNLLRSDYAGNSGVVYPDGTLSLAGKVIQKEFAELEDMHHYCPIKLAKTENVAYQPTATIKVNGGTNYDKLTLVTKTTKGPKTLRIKLKEPATVCITVNGKYNYTSTISPVDRYSIDIPEGIVDGFNQIEIFFGNYQVPFEVAVEAVNLK